VWVHAQQGGPVGQLCPLVRAVADRLAGEVLSGRRPPCAGVWELREPRDLVSADIGRWVALDRAVRLAALWRRWVLRPAWVRARGAVRRRVLAALLPDGGLPRTYDPGDTSADGASLMAVVFGLLRPGDVRTDRLVRATLDALGADCFTYRYPPTGDDGFAPGEGAFLPVSWWAVSALARVGRLDEAGARARALDEALPRLMPEEWDPVAGEGLGNVPLVWSHAECARALYLLDAVAHRSRHRGPARRPLTFAGSTTARRAAVPGAGQVLQAMTAPAGPHPSGPAPAVPRCPLASGRCGSSSPGARWTTWGGCRRTCRARSGW